MTPSTPTCSEDKYTRRIQRIEDALQKISSSVDRSDIMYHLRGLRDETRDVKDNVCSQVVLAETALRELKDLLEDDKQKEDGN